MGTNYFLVKNRPSISSGLHIGKSSDGWRFLFERYSILECGRSLNTFEQWRDYIKETTEAGTHVIIDEYDKIVLYDDLIKLIDMSGYRFL